MYGIPDRLKALSAAEEQVLLALWDCKPPVSRRDIGARLAEKGWAAATVLNFLYRLEEKGWVTCTKEQNHNLYAPTVTRRAYGVYTMRQRLDTVFGGDLAQAVRALVSESGCSKSTQNRKNMTCMIRTVKPLSLAALVGFPVRGALGRPLNSYWMKMHCHP